MAKSGLPARTPHVTASRDTLAPELDAQPWRATRRHRRRDVPRHHLFSTAARLALFIGDAAALGVAFSAANRLHDVFGRGALGATGQADSYGLIVGLAIVATLAAFSASGMYSARRSVSRTDEVYRVLTRITFGLIVGIAVTSLAEGDDFAYARWKLIYGWALAVVLVTASRFINDALVGTLRARGVAADRLLIVGTGSTAATVLDKVRMAPRLGYDLIGFVRHGQSGHATTQDINGVPVLGTTDDLARIVETYDIGELIIALAGTHHEEILQLVHAVTDYPVAIRVFPDTFRLLTSDSLNVTDLGGLPTVNVRTVGLRPVDRVLKRVMDIVVSGAMLVLLSPLILLIAIGVKLTSRGPVFYVQERVGQDGRAFHLIKFRTMRVDAEAESGPVFATPDDPRRTRFGRWLRRYSLDELPQFVNVLLGEMSVVGPRPERPYFVEQFRQRIPAYMARHHEKSGITGWAQVNGLRGDTSIEERTRYDLYYVENWSIMFDIRIMIRTLAHIFSRSSNAY